MGYVPMAVLDWDLFVKGFLVGENVGRGGNGMPWWTMLESNLGFSLIPWVFWVWTAPWIAWKTWNVQSVEARRLMVLGLCFSIPLLAFFTLHPYRHNHYGLPAIPAVLLFAAAAWLGLKENRDRRWIFAERSWMAVWACMLAGLAFASWKFHERFSSELLTWAPHWTWIFACSSLLFCSGVVSAIMATSGKYLGRRRELFVASTLSAWIGLGLWMAVLGEREMVDLRNILRDFPREKIAYDNLHRHPWSEWAYLQYMVGTPITGLHSREDLSRFVLEEEASPRWLLVPGESRIGEVRDVLQKEFPNWNAETHRWKRWGVHPPVGEAWTQKKLSLLEREFFMIRLTPRHTAESRAKISR
jgi:hypothetical protein